MSGSRSRNRPCRATACGDWPSAIFSIAAQRSRMSGRGSWFRYSFNVSRCLAESSVFAGTWRSPPSSKAHCNQKQPPFNTYIKAANEHLQDVEASNRLLAQHLGAIHYRFRLSKPITTRPIPRPMRKRSDVLPAAIVAWVPFPAAQGQSGGGRYSCGTGLCAQTNCLW